MTLHMGNGAGWWLGLPCPITVTDTAGVILAMNEASVQHYARFGGSRLIGSNMLDCHPELPRAKVARMLAKPGANVYMVERDGVRHLVYQSTWYEGDDPAGLVEMIVELPERMELLVRSPEAG